MATKALTHQGSRAAKMKKMATERDPSPLLAEDWSLEEEAVPEVFNLPPLSEKQISVRIVRMERGRF